MEEVTRKKGALTPDELATYGIPLEQKPSRDPNVKVSDETEKESAEVGRNSRH